MKSVLAFLFLVLFHSSTWACSYEENREYSYQSSNQQSCTGYGYCYAYDFNPSTGNYEYVYGYHYSCQGQQTQPVQHYNCVDKDGVTTSEETEEGIWSLCQVL